MERGDMEDKGPIEGDDSARGGSTDDSGSNDPVTTGHGPRDDSHVDAGEERTDNWLTEDELPEGYEPGAYGWAHGEPSPGSHVVGNEPALTEDYNWDAWSHAELYRMVHDNEVPGESFGLGQEWIDLGVEISDAARDIMGALRSSEAGWTGPAADATRTAISRLAVWLAITGDAAEAIGRDVQTMSTVMGTARVRMPEPVGGAFTITDDPNGFADVPSDNAVAAARADDAKEIAVAVMDAMEADAQALDAITAVFHSPYNPITGANPLPEGAERVVQTGGADALVNGTGYGTGSGASANGEGDPSAPGDPTGADGEPYGSGSAASAKSGTASDQQPEQAAEGSSAPSAGVGDSSATTSATAGPEPKHALYQGNPAAVHGSEDSRTADARGSYQDGTTTAAAVTAPGSTASPFTERQDTSHAQNRPTAGSGYGGGGFFPGARGGRLNRPQSRKRQDRPAASADPRDYYDPKDTDPRTYYDPSKNAATSGGYDPKATNPRSYYNPPDTTTPYVDRDPADSETGTAKARGGTPTATTVGQPAQSGANGGSPATGAAPMSAQMVNGGAGTAAASSGSGHVDPGAGMPMMPMMPMGGAGGQGGQDQEHKTPGYIKGEPVFEGLGDDLPPPVIGGGPPRRATEK